MEEDEIKQVVESWKAANEEFAKAHTAFVDEFVKTSLKTAKTSSELNHELTKLSDAIRINIDLVNAGIRSKTNEIQSINDTVASLSRYQTAQNTATDSIAGFASKANKLSANMSEMPKQIPVAAGTNSVNSKLNTTNTDSLNDAVNQLTKYQTALSKPTEKVKTPDMSEFKLNKTAILDSLIQKFPDINNKHPKVLENEAEKISSNRFAKKAESDFDSLCEVLEKEKASLLSSSVASEVDTSKYLESKLNSHKKEKASSDSALQAIMAVQRTAEHGAVTMKELKHAIELGRDAITSADSPEIKEQIRREMEGIEKLYAKELAIQTIKNTVGVAFATTLTSMVSAAKGTVSELMAANNGISIANTLMKKTIDIETGMVTAATSGISKFGNSLAGAGGLLGGFGVALSVGGAVATQAANAAAELLKSALDMLMAGVTETLSTFHTVSNAGVMFANGMTGMRDAAFKSGFTLEIFSKAISSNSDAFAMSSMSMTTAAKKLSEVGDYVKNSGIQQSLLNLGYSFEDSADMQAKVLASMSRWGKNPSAEAVALETQRYAENLRLISNLTGKDAKAMAEKEAKADETLAFQNKMQGLGYNQTQISQMMSGLTETQQQGVRDLVLFRGYVNKGAATLAALSGGNNAVMRDVAAKITSGSTDMLAGARAVTMHSAQIQEEAKKASSTVGLSEAAGQSGNAAEGARALFESQVMANQLTPQKFAKAEADLHENKNTNDTITHGLVKIEQKGIDLQNEQQKIVTNNLGAYAKELNKQLDIIKTYQPVLNTFAHAATTAADIGISAFTKFSGWVDKFIIAHPVAAATTAALGSAALMAVQTVAPMLVFKKMMEAKAAKIAPPAEPVAPPAEPVTPPVAPPVEPVAPPVSTAAPVVEGGVTEGGATLAAGSASTVETGAEVGGSALAASMPELTTGLLGAAAGLTAATAGIGAVGIAGGAGVGMLLNKYTGIQHALSNIGAQGNEKQASGEEFSKTVEGKELAAKNRERMAKEKEAKLTQVPTLTYTSQNDEAKKTAEQDKKTEETIALTKFVEANTKKIEGELSKHSVLLKEIAKLLDINNTTSRDILHKAQQQVTATKGLA